MLYIYILFITWTSQPTEAGEHAHAWNVADRSHMSRSIPREPIDIAHDSTILWFAQSFLIKHELFSGFGQSFCYIVATVLNHSCYSAQLF
jgi:hypothetical protein